MSLSFIRGKTIPLVLFLAVFCGRQSAAWAAISASIVHEVRTTGLNTNSGGFNSTAAGTDWSLQDAPQYSVADGVTAGTTTITSATAAFGVDVVGNLIYVQGGTGSITAGWYEITARASTTSITVDRSTGLTTGTGVTLHIGGALLTPAQANTNAVAGNLVYIKAGTYTISSLITNDAAVTWIGYNTTRTPFNTDATLPAFSAGANTFTMFSLHAGSQGNEMRNISFDANSHTTVTALVLANNFASVRRCKAANFNIGFLTNWNENVLADCYTTGCTTGFSCTAGTPNMLTGCVAVGGGVGFGIGQSYSSLVNCIASGCTTRGFQIAGQQVLLLNCSAYNCTGTQFYLNSQAIECRNCVAYGGAAWQFDGLAASNHNRLINCASDAGGSGASQNFTAYEIGGFITLTANPYTNAGSGDFSLNSTAGGGAAIRAIAMPTSFTGIATTNALDIGAVQSQSSSGGGKKVGPGGGKVGLIGPAIRLRKAG